MPFLAECPLCDTEVRFTEKPAGEARCPQCSTVMVVDAGAVPEQEWVVEHAAEDETPRRRFPRWLLALNGLALLAAAAFGVYQFTKPKPDPRIVSLDVGEWPAVKTPKGVDPATVVTVRVQVPDSLTGAYVSKLLFDSKPRAGRVRTGTNSGLRHVYLAYPAENPADVAKEIDFGAVARVDGRVVYVLADVAPGHPGPDADDVDRALFLFRNTESFYWHTPISMLGDTPTADGRRAEVVEHLLSSVEGRDGWMRLDDKLPKLISWVADEDLPRLAAAMRKDPFGTPTRGLLARLEEPRVRELIKLIGPGPGEEQEIEFFLRGSRNDAQVIAGLQLLRDIGTQDRLPWLRSLALQSANLNVQAAANEAVEVITNRANKKRAPRLPAAPDE